MPYSESSRKPLTYSSYLKLDELLELQRPLSPGPEHDELLFIVIHQVYELWFKQVNHELEELQRNLEQGDAADALAGFNRVRMIMKTLVAQVDVLETMSPTSFLSFRDRLASASGFQSAQFRETEFLLGMKSRKTLRHHPPGSRGRRRLDELMNRPSLWDSFLRYLERNGYSVPTAALERDVSRPPEPDPGVQAILVDLYRKDHLATMVCERMVDLDEGLQEWRYRHVKMVERTIGAKPGTGGSAGAGYLKTTLFRPLFPDLWAIRSAL